MWKWTSKPKWTSQKEWTYQKHDWMYKMNIPKKMNIWRNEHLKKKNISIHMYILYVFTVCTPQPVPTCSVVFVSRMSSSSSSGSDEDRMPLCKVFPFACKGPPQNKVCTFGMYIILNVHIICAYCMFILYVLNIWCRIWWCNRPYSLNATLTTWGPRQP